MNLKISRIFKNDNQNNLIQILGLVLGLVTCIVIGQYAYFHYSFDEFHKNNDLIYRTQNTEPRLVGELAKDKLSYVENYARLHPCYRGVMVNIEDKSFHEKKAYFADGSLFEFFTFPVKKGDAIEALKVKNQMVISADYAKKYFGNENPIGKTLQVNGAYESNVTYTVGAVFKNIPKNSHLKFDVLFSMENILSNSMYTESDAWRWGNFFTYLKTNVPIETDLFDTELSAVANNNGAQEENGNDATFKVSKLSELHLNGQTNYMDNNRTVQDVNVRILMALVILIIAWLNFINIGIGSALKHKLSLNVKKVLGASPLNIWGELFKKAAMLNLVAFIISVIVYYVLSSVFRKVGIVQMTPTFLSQATFWLLVLALQLAGVFVVSLSIHGLVGRQKITATLTKQSKSATKKQSPWIALFVLQFGASIVLVSFALFSTKQINEIMNVETGIRTKQILAIHSANYAKGGDISKTRSIFEQEVLKIPGVSVSTSSSYIPGSRIASFMPTRLSWKTSDDNVESRMNFVGYDYLSLFQHQLIAGRNFSKEFSSDKTGVIINESLAKAYGFNDANEALGKQIFWEFRNANRTIVGVISDFHQQSADVQVEPTMFQLWDHARGYCLLSVETGNVKKNLAEIENLWNTIHKSNAFNYLWVDDHYQGQFQKWVEYSQMVKLFSMIAILIACIGLFGLSSMLLRNRTKEIGIRKVNGAKISEILTMLNKDFIKWVAIAFVIATPIAYYAMNLWLENFAYKTTLRWWIFALAGVMALGIALLTVSWQSWKAATRNPVEALRYE